MGLNPAPGLLFQKLRRNKAQELSTTRIKVKTFTSGLCFNVHLDSMRPAVKLLYKAALFLKVEPRKGEEERPAG